MKILLGTNNLHKLKEFNEIFKEENIDIELLSLKDMDFKVDEPVEDGSSFYENAVIKAKYFYEKYQIPCISDDSGIVVDVLEGKPGIYSARYASFFGLESNAVNNRHCLIEQMKGQTNRHAHFECTLVFYDGKNIISSTGKMEGLIGYEDLGENGFGYDPLFILPQYNKSVGEIDEKIKNKLSHRYNAIINFIQQFKAYK